MAENTMEIKRIDYDFSVCKVEDYSLAKLDSEYCFIGIFAISTFNTDYIMTKQENYERALKLLQDAGYKIV